MKFWAEHPVLLCVVLLFSVGMIGAYWEAAIFIGFVAAVCYGFYRLVVGVDRRFFARMKRQRELVAHADYEHWLILNGDDRGVWGQYPPYTTK